MLVFIGGLRTLNELLTAGIAITAFSLLLYALSFNLRDRVARSFALILACVVTVFVGEAIAGVATPTEWITFWYQIQWLGIIYLPPAYLHFSDALLATTGRPSRGRRRLLIRIIYLISTVFLITLYTGHLVGPLVIQDQPTPYLQRRPLTWVFAAFYVLSMVWAWVNFWRAYQRTVTSTSQRRMLYLISGSLAPALGSYPYLLFGSGFAARHELIFWSAATVSNILVSVFIVLMAYAVAFFGVPWPDRVVKRRLFKWLMRGPVTASTVLSITTIVRRIGASMGTVYSAAVPIAMAGTLLLMQYLITILAPLWERWLFYGGDRDQLQLLQTLEERLLTSSDLRQFLEAVLTGICDRLQVPSAFVAALGSRGVELWVSVGDRETLNEEILSEDLLQVVVQNGNGKTSSKSPMNLFSWGDFWLIPLYHQQASDQPLLGLLGVIRNPEQAPDEEQREALLMLTRRVAIALEDRHKQQQVFSSLESLTPEVDLIQRLRAASRYDGGNVLITTPEELESDDLAQWVKDALSHYWGGPKLTESPLLQLKVVQEAAQDIDGGTVNALREILRRGIEHVKPEGERRFTAEWILYNILEMKFMEGRKVREIAMRLAMSEADLYRKQRVAVEAVANAIVEMEVQARKEGTPVNHTQLPKRYIDL
ncbi:MAG: hypothetical protein JW862_06445 [Anaerolineales bacterium]|nr:hypothetical protein [Anaerolineales bacterium]